MANLYITEFRGVATVNYAVTQAPIVPPVAQQKVVFTTSTASAAVNDSTEIVGILSDAACHIEWGTAPTATTDSMRVPADTLLYFAVGKGMKVAAVTA